MEQSGEISNFGNSLDQNIERVLHLQKNAIKIIAGLKE